MLIVAESERRAYGGREPVAREKELLTNSDGSRLQELRRSDD